jgi:hypothetical protein
LVILSSSMLSHDMLVIPVMLPIDIFVLGAPSAPAWVNVDGPATPLTYIMYVVPERTKAKWFHTFFVTTFELIENPDPPMNTCPVIVAAGLTKYTYQPETPLTQLPIIPCVKLFVLRELTHPSTVKSPPLLRSSGPLVIIGVVSPLPNPLPGEYEPVPNSGAAVDTLAFPPAVIILLTSDESGNAVDPFVPSQWSSKATFEAYGSLIPETSPRSLGHRQ